MAESDEEADRAERFRRALEADTLDAIEGHRTRFEATGNPLYVWRALQDWSNVNRERRRVRQPPVHMPDWCALQIAVYAHRLVDLSRGRDFRLAPRPVGQGERTPEAEKAHRDRGPTLKPQEARRLLAVALDMTSGRGRGAFAEIRSLDAADLDRLARQLYREAEGKIDLDTGRVVPVGKRIGEGEAVEMLAEDHGFADARSARKRLSPGKRKRPRN
jgi:hypothetical protein